MSLLNLKRRRYTKHGGYQERHRATPDNGGVGSGGQLRGDHNGATQRQAAEPLHLGWYRWRTSRGQHRSTPSEVQERRARPQRYVDDSGRAGSLPLCRSARRGRGDGERPRGPRPYRRALAEVLRRALATREYKERAGDAVDRPFAADRSGPRGAGRTP